MWCTRWFIPLLLLPLPTAPPLFLLLFLFTLTMHAKPCFYCIILLSTLFVSTCHRQPLSLETLLVHPWSENITTFGQALNSTLDPSYSKPLPSMISPADRCWCDLSPDGFFEPFNTSQWEITSVRKMKAGLERQQRREDARQQELERQNSTQKTSSASSASMPKTATPMPTGRPSRSLTKGIWSLLKSRSLQTRSSSVAKQEDRDSSDTAPLDDALPGPLFRREYDLRRFGVEMLLDFGFSPKT